VFLEFAWVSAWHAHPSWHPGDAVHPLLALSPRPLLSEQRLPHGLLWMDSHPSIHPSVPGQSSSSSRAATTAGQAPQRSQLHS